MSVLTLLVDLYSAEDESAKEAAHARFNERKFDIPTMGELATNKLRECSASDGTPLLAADERVELEGGRLVVYKED